MTLKVLFIIMIIAWLLGCLKWRRASIALYAASVLLLLAIGCGAVPRWVLGDLQSAYAEKPVIGWGTRNAIVLLGTGTDKISGMETLEPSVFSYARIVRAAELYNECRQTRATCKIIVSGGDAKKNGESEASVYAVALTRIGVDTADIIHEQKSMNTWQNAEFTKAILESYDADRMVLVSSGVHLRRSLLYFSHFGVSATPARADYLSARPSVLPLAYNFTVTDFSLSEYIGIARYYVYNALGWNGPRKPM
ncbi:YdcF family protein [Pandoraea sp. NPDC090278]|uniref:YdcF family protein n=1 Tax=Pandoraea sp. NPDC090278 TaxID=3364391 RepID=UPI00383B02A6